jgi:hypothetical protein
MRLWFYYMVLSTITTLSGSHVIGLRARQCGL